MKFKKHSIISNVTITHLGYGGVGVATHQSGKKILVKHGLPGSVVDVKVIKNKNDYVQGVIENVIQSPKERTDGEIRCPHYSFPYRKDSGLAEHKQGCGGCKRQIVPYSKQCELKEQIVRDALHPLIEKYSFDWYPLVQSPHVFHYRNKIEFSFGKYLVKNKQEQLNNSNDEKHKFSIAQHWQMGFHKQGEFSKVVDIDQCFLVSKKVHAVYQRIKSDLLASGIPVYDVKTHQGCLRHLVIREGIHTGHCMVNLALSDKRLHENPKYQRILDGLIETWSKELEEVTTMVLTTNNGLADIVHGSDSTTQPCRGEGVIYEGLQFAGIDLLRFQVSPFSFFQTNTLGAEQLFSHAKSLLGKSITGNIIDLYCGSGTIGLSFLAQGIGKKLYGIEIVESAVKDAYNNAKINGLGDRCKFWSGKAEKLLFEDSLGDEAFIGNDLVIIDPPRSGLHPKVIEFLRASKQRYGFKLLYISCNPVTMGRDMEGLLEGGVFVLEKIQPVDMFPQTHHIEVIGVMK